MKGITLVKIELYFYFLSWICGILYSSYHVYLIGKQYSYSFERDLSKGWSILNQRKDDTDEEWALWRNLILQTLSRWVVVNYVGARAIELLNIKLLLPVWYFLLTSALLISRFGIHSFLFFVPQPLLFTVLLYSKNFRFSHYLLISVVLFFIKYHFGLNLPTAIFWVALLYFNRLRVWLFCFILFFVFTDSNTLTLYTITENDMKLFLPTLMWIYLRCISFYLEERHRKLNWFTFFSFLGYVFYLPTFFMGPILLYCKFSKRISYGRAKFDWKSVALLIVNNIRYIFWMFVTEFLLHFIYINCLLKYIQFLTTLKYNVWIMYGIGFGMGQFFFLKYTVVYGLALTWTKAEGYDVPRPPKCVAYICLYSDMWRFFDEGLYLFIRRYIYEPCMRSRPPSYWVQLISSSLCFVFVFIWHGLYDWIFMWALFNFCGIVVEKAARRISKTTLYYNFENLMSFWTERRFVAFICAPFTILSAISNFYFLGGSVVAQTYFTYIFRNDNLSTTFCLWFFVYCLCHVSMEIKGRRIISYSKWC